jgi:hypothetical protein
MYENLASMHTEVSVAYGSEQQLFALPVVIARHAAPGKNVAEGLVAALRCAWHEGQLRAVRH